jgi:hypothetical protein
VHDLVAGDYQPQLHIHLRFAEGLDAHRPGILRKQARGQADGGYAAIGRKSCIPSSDGVF